jgi:hypothetical protein
MAMQLERVVPLGRSLDEYVKMFNLTATDLQRTILSVGDGPASFNAEGTKLGYQIKSTDPLYVFSAEQIQTRFDAVIDNIIGQVRRTPEDWVWTYHASVEALRTSREQTTERFCADYEAGRTEGRYEVAELPNLPYSDQQFDLGLSSHFLFLYSDLLDAKFHLEGIREMLRVCEEVRIFPLLTLRLQRSPHIDYVVSQLQESGYQCEIEKASYELQRGGNEMLKIQK